MANRTVPDLPIAGTAAGTDLLHVNQSLTDKKITLDKVSEFVLNSSGNSPVVVNISGTHVVSTVIRYQYIHATISSDATVTLPGAYGGAQEITIKNNPSSTANVIGLPESQVLYPGQEITFIWNGTAFVRKQFINSPIVSTTAPGVNPSFIGQMYINTSNNNVYKAKATGAVSDWINVSNNNIETSTKTTNYTILNSDIEEIFIAQPNTSGNYGVREIKAPANGSTTSRKFRVEHGSNRGLVKVNANQDSVVQWFDWDGTDVKEIPLYMPGQYVEFYWNPNLAKWSVGDYKIKMPVGLLRRTNWSGIHIGGNAMQIDNLSTGNDLTGQVVTEATSGGSAIVANRNGTQLAFYDMQPLNFNYFTNDRVLTASDGTTMQVNETSAGTTINTNYPIVHSFQLPPRSIDYEIVLTDNNITENGILYRGFSSVTTSGVTAWCTPPNPSVNEVYLRSPGDLYFADTATSITALGSSSLYYILPTIKY